MNEDQSVKTKTQENKSEMQIQFQKSDEDKQNEIQDTNGAIPVNKQKRSQLEQARQIVSARQILKLSKNDSPVFLAIVRVNETPNKRDIKRGKRSHGREARFDAAHGITEGHKRKINKKTGPKKDFFSVEEENNRFSQVTPNDTGKTWNYSLMNAEMSFQKNCRRVYLPHERYNM